MTAKNSQGLTESRRVAAAKTDAVFSDMDKRAAENFFSRRGFSARTIHALVESGIHLPEEVLFLSDERAEHIAGLDAGSLAEIEAYRSRFLPTPALGPASAKPSSCSPP